MISVFDMICFVTESSDCELGSIYMVLLAWDIYGDGMGRHPLLPLAALHNHWMAYLGCLGVGIRNPVIPHPIGVGIDAE